MPTYKLQIVRETKQLAFECQHCKIEREASSYDTYNRPYRSRSRYAGQCPTCVGTGFHPERDNAPCEDCKGLGLCSECRGKPVRSWFEIPRRDKRFWHRHWRRFKTQPASFEALTGLYRDW